MKRQVIILLPPLQLERAWPELHPVDRVIVGGHVELAASRGVTLRERSNGSATDAVPTRM